MSHLFGTAQRGVDDRQAAGQHRRSLLGLTSWQQHCLLVTDFQKHYGVSLPEAEQTQKTDLDSIVEHHRCAQQLWTTSVRELVVLPTLVVLA